MIEKAKEELLDGSHSIVVAGKDGVTAARSGEGVRPLLTLYRETPELLKDAAVADKVIGKAAASILALAGVREVYGHVLSRGGVSLLEKYGIPYTYGTLVDFVTNRRGDGMCPLEQTVLPYDRKENAFEALNAFLMGQAKK
jgi:hypothetical protein